MKRKALKIKLLFILFTISCLSAFSQDNVNKNVRDVWFPALKAETDGDNIYSTLEITLSPLDPTLGLVEEERLLASIYPVPVQDVLHIALDKPTSGTVNIRIQSLSGSQVFAKSFAVTSGQTVKQIEVNNLYAGMYLVIVSSNDFVQKFKMLKQ